MFIYKKTLHRSLSTLIALLWSHSIKPRDLQTAADYCLRGCCFWMQFLLWFIYLRNNCGRKQYDLTFSKLSSDMCAAHHFLNEIPVATFTHIPSKRAAKYLSPDKLLNHRPQTRDFISTAFAGPVTFDQNFHNPHRVSDWIWLNRFDVFLHVVRIAISVPITHFTRWPE
jgi:hypothetical protein